MNPPITRDERETAIDLAADRLTFLVLAYGLLALAAWRSFNGEAAWDLLGLVVVGGLAGLVYRFQKGVVTGRWAAVLLVTVVIAAIGAGIVALQLPR